LQNSGPKLGGIPGRDIFSKGDLIAGTSGKIRMSHGRKQKPCGSFKLIEVQKVLEVGR
jgi:hypothetical protein